MLESVAPAALGPSAQGEVITGVENTVSGAVDIVCTQFFGLF